VRAHLSGEDIEYIQTAGYREITLHFEFYSRDSLGTGLTLWWNETREVTATERYHLDTINIMQLPSLGFSKTYPVQGPTLMIDGRPLGFDWVDIFWYATT
jgi:hypothetical protein